MKKIIITGGAGYVGSELSSYLAKLGNEIIVYDLMLYGSNNLEKEKNIQVVNGDIRDTQKFINFAKDCEICIHLACISNDPSFELNPELGKEINFNSFEPILKSCLNIGIKKFIYASSSSVYGVKKEKNISENLSLEPLTDYSKYKARCEDILQRYSSKNFTTCILRPATVCGYSRRQRLDLVVNILTNFAYHNKLIKVFGGEQLRPNININDMIRAYELIINSPNDKINGEIFNVGFENHSVNDLSIIVKQSVENILNCEIKIEKFHSEDNRSYHISSNKITNKLGFQPKFNIQDGVNDLLNCFKKNILIDPLNNENYYNIKKMKLTKLK